MMQPYDPILQTGAVSQALGGASGGGNNVPVDFSNIGNPYSTSSSSSHSGLPKDFLNVIRGLLPGLADTGMYKQSLQNLMNMPATMANMGNQIGSSWGATWANPVTLPDTVQAAPPAPAATNNNSGLGSFLSRLFRR